MLPSYAGESARYQSYPKKRDTPHPGDLLIANSLQKPTESNQEESSPPTDEDSDLDE